MVVAVLCSTRAVRNSKALQIFEMTILSLQQYLQSVAARKKLRKVRRIAKNTLAGYQYVRLRFRTEAKLGQRTTIMLVDNHCDKATIAVSSQMSEGIHNLDPCSIDETYDTAVIIAHLFAVHRWRY